MSGDKTPQQLKADDLMRKAFEACTRAYTEPGEESGVIVDSMAIVMTSRIGDDGRMTTAASVYFGGVETPRYRVTGMMDEATNRLDEQRFEDDED